MYSSFTKACRRRADTSVVISVEGGPAGPAYQLTLPFLYRRGGYRRRTRGTKVHLEERPRFNEY